MVQDDSHGYDQQRGGGKSMGGAGETATEKTIRVFNAMISKTKKDIEALRKHRVVVKGNRLRNRWPHVAIVGYTNAGKQIPSMNTPSFWTHTCGRMGDLRDRPCPKPLAGSASLL